MKTALFKISGEPADGDLAVVAYTGPRGGMSYATYKVKGARHVIGADPVTGDSIAIAGAPLIPGDTLEAIARGLAESINHGLEYAKDSFDAVVAGEMLIVTCSDLVSDVTFIAQFQGAGTGKIEQLT